MRKHHFHCNICGCNFTVGFWKWLFAKHFDGWHYSYVKCPLCNQVHYLEDKDVKV